MAAEYKKPTNGNGAPAKQLRCAIYTRKSTDEGLDQDFNSLDAQREAAESYVTSQRGEGWSVLPEHYDDGGFTGASMDRPALKRLLADIEKGVVNCVVVYKVDRLTRSLLDFSRIMEIFDRHGATFVSVTQQFNTTSSLGRLTLHILLSFAQFEREMISERTRDKMSAARRKGKWVGGGIVLGYDLAPQGGALLVNPAEAERVSAIFRMYLELGSLIPVVQELEKRNWRMKEWTTREGRPIGGAAFNKTKLHNLLTNVVYCGKVAYEGQIYEGEHERIVDDETWNAVQEQLNRNGRRGGRNVRNKYGALLKGLVRCESCNVGMTHTYVQKSGNKLYRYYVCINAHQSGWNKCETRSVPAPDLESAVVSQLRGIARNPGMLSEVIEQLGRLRYEATKTLNDRKTELIAQRSKLEKEIAAAGSVAGSRGPSAKQAAERLAQLHEQAAEVDRVLASVSSELDSNTAQAVDPGTLKPALESFEPLWEHMNTWEREKFISSLVSEVRYDGRSGAVTVSFRSNAVKQLCCGETPMTKEDKRGGQGN